MILVPDLKGENPDSARFSAQGDQAMRRQCLGFTQVLSYQGQCSSLCLLCLVQLLVTPWTVAHQAPLSTGFSRQEYWSGLPFLPLGDLPDSGIERISLASPALAGRFFTTEPPGKPLSSIHRCLFSTKKKKKTFFSPGFPDSSVGKESACSAGDSGSIPGSGRSLEKG